MALEIRLQVTQPYHGPGGEVLFEPGRQFPVGADLPDDLRTAPVIAEAGDVPAEAAADVPASAKAPARGAKPAPGA